MKMILRLHLNLKKYTKKNLLKIISNLITKKLNINNYHFLSGPSFADEVLYGKPTALSLSSQKVNKNIGNIFKYTNIRIYYSEGLKTLEFLSIIKNIYAIGAGIIDAESLGQNARSAYITRCVAEIKSMIKYLNLNENMICLLYTSPSPRDATLSRMPSSA